MIASRGRAWLAAILIFGFGLAVGAAGMAWAGLNTFRRSVQAPAGMPALANRAVDRIGADLKKNLDLTPDEAARVDAILTESAVNLRQLRARLGQDAGREVRDAVRRIALELPPEKRRAFYRLMLKRYDRLGVAPPAGIEP